MKQPGWWQRTKWWFSLIGMVIFLAVGQQKVGQAQAPVSDFAQQVVELTNAARVAEGLPPLKRHEALTAAAQGHTDDMAQADFYDHINPLTGSEPGDRVTDAGYVWAGVGENIATGQTTAAEVVEDWLNSPGHYANIMNPDFYEIGVGYTFDSGDTLVLEAGSLPLVHYWAQNFGQQRDSYPLVINNEVAATDSLMIDLYLYGETWAQEMRLRDEGRGFTEWQPFQSEISWTLSPGDGERTVTVELRNGTNVITSRDTIFYTRDEEEAGMGLVVNPRQQPLPESLPDPVPDSITISRDPEQLFIEPGQASDVTLTLSGSLPDVCQGIPGRPINVMVVFDRSTSAGAGPGSNLEASKAAALTFLDNLEQPIYTSLTELPDPSQMGLITSAVDANGPIPFLDQELTADYAFLRQKISGIQAAGDSELADGIDLATTSLQSTSGNLSQVIFLVLHDDLPLNDPAAEAVARAQTQGITVYILVNNLNIEDAVQISTEEAAAVVGSDQVTMLQFNEGTPDAAQLRALFIQASEGTTGSSGRNLHLVETFTPADDVAIEDIGQGGEVNNGVIAWSIETLAPDQPVTLTYSVRVPAGANTLNTRHTDQFNFLDCNGYLQTGSLPEETIQIGPTRTPTPTPTPTNTPSPSPTPTARGIEVLPTPGPTPTPTRAPLAETLIPTSPGRAFCSSPFWWLPALILPLLVLLLWWWWLRRNGTDFRHEIGRLWTPRCWPCLLFWLYFLFLAFLIGRELSSGLCRPGESVYFWRMEQNGFGQSGLYLTVPDDETNEVIPFAAVNNQAACIGCHSVTSTGDAVAVVEGSPPNRVHINRLDGSVIDIPEIMASFVAWSPDGTQLAYDGLAGDISILDLPTGQTRPVSGASEPGITEVMPAWSADGTTLAFVRYEGTVEYSFALPGPTDIYVVPVNGGEAVPVAGASGDGLNYYPSFSPDGRWLAFTHHNGDFTYSDPEAEIYLVPAAGGEPIRLAANDGPNGEVLPGASNSWPTWSQDGQYLAFNSKRYDESFDIFLTQIDENGYSTAATPLPGAAAAGVFEHIPFWGEPIQLEPLGLRLLNLWPWLLPLLLFLILCLLLCRGEGSPPPDERPQPQPRSRPEPGKIQPWRPTPFWDPGAALIIGLGGSGRHVLTQLKKNLLDAGAGQWPPPQIRLLLLDTPEAESTGGQQKPVEFAGIHLDDQEKMVLDEHLFKLVRDMVGDKEMEPELRRWFPWEAYNNHLQENQYNLQGGTHGRRPLGRAAFFRQIQQGGSHSAFWQWLKANIQQTTENQQVHIYVVTSLAGGLGSGVVADVAYLARLAAAELNTSSTVEGFLIGDGAFQKVVTDQDTQKLLRANTLATLRELNRFQLAAGRPYPFIYREGQADAVLSGYCRASVFDHLHLVDNNALWASQTPEVSIFPATADWLMSLLDRASRAPDQAVQPYLANVQAATAKLQAHQGMAAVGTAGSFVYRLPFLNIINTLENRFALELLALFLTGSDAVAENIDLKAEYNRESLGSAGSSPSVTVHAGDILRGYEGLMPPHELRLVDIALSDGPVLSGNNRALLVGLLSQMQVSDAAAFSQNRRLAFQDYLVKTLLPVLNGRIDSDLRTARTGKLGYVEALLAAVAQRLKDHSSALDTVHYSLPADQAQKVKLLQELHLVCAEAVAIVQRHLVAQKDILVKGVYPLLQEDKRTLVAHCQQMKAIRVRHYLMEESYLDQLYNLYLRPHLLNQAQGTGLLAQLFWQTIQDAQDGPQVRLTVRTTQDSYLTGGQDGTRLFSQALYALAGQGLSELDRRKNTLLAAQLTATWLNSDNLGKTARTLLENSAVLADIRRDATNITSLQANHFLYANSRIAERGELMKQLTPLLGGMSLNLVAATDPFTLQFVTYRDVVAISAFRVWEQAAATYRHYLTQQGWHEPIHVFPAEQVSTPYEFRLGELQADHRFFVPLLTAGLDDETRARRFALAVVAGLIAPSYERGEQYVYRLQTGSVNVALTRLEDAQGWLAPLLTAMHTFVLGHPDPHEAHRNHSLEQLSTLVEEALVADPVGLLARLNQFQPENDPVWRRELNQVGGHDLLAFIQLVLGDKRRELQRSLNVTSQ